MGVVLMRVEVPVEGLGGFTQSCPKDPAHKHNRLLCVSLEQANGMSLLLLDSGTQGVFVVRLLKVDKGVSTGYQLPDGCEPLRWEDQQFLALGQDSIQARIAVETATQL